MKRKVFIPCLLLIMSCGYFENDRILFQKQIIGNIKLYQNENSSEVQLALSEDNNSYSIIIQNCNKIFYDSIHKKVYVESILNEYNLNYYQVNILNSESTIMGEAFMQYVIQKPTFDSLIINQKLVFSKKDYK